MEKWVPSLKVFYCMPHDEWRRDIILSRRLMTVLCRTPTSRIPCENRVPLQTCRTTSIVCICCRSFWWFCSSVQWRSRQAAPPGTNFSILYMWAEFSRSMGVIYSGMAVACKTLESETWVWKDSRWSRNFEGLITRFALTWDLFENFRFANGEGRELWKIW